MIPSTGRFGRKGAAVAMACALALAQAPAALGPMGQALAQEAASAVQDVALQDVALAFGETRVTAPSVAVSGTRLSKEDLLAIFRADGKEPWPSRLARLDAGSLAVPELRVERTIGTKREVAVYRDVAAKGVHAGRIAELTAAGATLTVEADPQSGNGTYGRMRAEDVDLAALARLYSEAGDGKGPFQRLYASFSLSDIVLNIEESTLAIAQVSGRDFAGRPIPATWSGAMDALGALGPDRKDPADRAKLFGIAADLAEAVSIGSLEATGLSSKTTKGDPVALGIGRIAYAGAGIAPGLALSDISFAGDGARSRIESIRLTGFSLEPTIATLRRIANSADASDAELRRLMPVIGTLAVSGFSLDLPPDDAGPAEPAPSKPSGDPLAEAVPDASSGVLHIGLRDATLTFGPPKDGVPTAGRLALIGLTLPSAAVAGVPGLGSLGFYGYRDLDLSLIADTAWDEQSKELALREVSVSGKDMGTLRLNATLGGIGPEVFDPDGAVAGYAMLSATAKALDLTLVNGGLFERFIDAQAKSLSLKPDELRQEYVTASVIGVPVILGNSAAAKSIGAAMGQFVSKPGTLSISAKAKNGAGLGVVDFSAAGTPAAVLDKLDVNAKAE